MSILHQRLFILLINSNKSNNSYHGIIRDYIHFQDLPRILVSEGKNVRKEGKWYIFNAIINNTGSGVRLLRFRSQLWYLIS